jgi:hypothetical protein
MTGKKLLLKNRGSFLILVLIFVVSGLCTTCAAEGDEAPSTNLWEQLRNTVWTKEWVQEENAWFMSNVIKTTIGFYGPTKGPYAHLVNQDAPYLVIHDEQDVTYIFDGDGTDYTNSEFSIISSIRIDRFGSLISGNFPSFHISVHISVFGDKLTISHETSNWWLFGTYTKISSDPNYDWELEDYNE